MDEKQDDDDDDDDDDDQKLRSSKLTRNKEWRKIPNLWFRHNSDFQTNHSQSFDGDDDFCKECHDLDLKLTVSNYREV